MCTRRAFTAKIARGSAAVPKLPVAAVVTTYGPVTHADVIVGKILEAIRTTAGRVPV